MRVSGGFFYKYIGKKGLLIGVKVGIERKIFIFVTNTPCQLFSV